MRTVTEEKPTVTRTANVPVLETFSATLRNGKVITIREMTGKDLVHIEENLSEMKETRKSFHIIELLNVGEDGITYEEIESLGFRDIRTISDLIGKANGDYDDGQPLPK